MIINTTRFGSVQVAEADMIQFAEGLLGFADLRKFVLLDDPGDEIFAWLQSCESPHIAFPVLEPEIFHPNYHVTLSKGDLESLKLSEQSDGKMISIVTIPADPTQMTANLKAPVVINLSLRLAKQCVLQDNTLAIREPIFTKLQQRIVQQPNVAIKEKSLTQAVAVRLSVAPSGSQSEGDVGASL